MTTCGEPAEDFVEMDLGAAGLGIFAILPVNKQDIHCAEQAWVVSRKAIQVVGTACTPYSLLELVTTDDTLRKPLTRDEHPEGSICSNQFQ